jgi:alpha-glucoside transport system substrate-binding protein
MKLKSMLAASTMAISLFAAQASAADLKYKPGEGPFTWSNLEDLKKIDLKGETLTMFGPWRGDDEKHVQVVLEYFRQATGADVKYASSENYEQQVVIDSKAGSLSNITVLPQPGLIADLAAQGFVTPLADADAKWMVDNYGAGQSWVDIGTAKGKDGAKHFYGFSYKTDVKSLVWYSPENFKDAGYKVPESMEDLMALTDKIIADGKTPWCIGLGSGGATGWPATDWIEDIMLRTQSAETYDGWVANTVKFNDPAVMAAMDVFGSIAKNDKAVDGGAKGVAAIDFRESPKGLFGAPPKCYMHHQASFIPSFFPEGSKVGKDVDFFYLPAFKSKPELGRPVLGAGTLFTITKDSKASRAFIDYLKLPLAHELWMQDGGFLTPLKSVNPAAYANDAARKQGEIMSTATTFRFDGSDLMPGKIGAGAFWTEMVNFVGGKSTKDTADSIQKAWDAIK